MEVEAPHLSERSKPSGCPPTEPPPDVDNAWVSDRTLCHPASGKPVVVQDTGPSEFLPNGEGIFRFGKGLACGRPRSTARAFPGHAVQGDHRLDVGRLREQVEALHLAQRETLNQTR